jgi:uncharacterized protein YndB with AHSA1/START domain
MSSDLGVITRCYTVTFERTTRHGPARLWKAITQPDEVAAWMGAPATIDLRPGGDSIIDFAGDDAALDGIIVRVEQERRFAYVWGRSYTEWLIEPDGDGCRYTFVETGLTDRGEHADEEGLAAGWHKFLDRFADHLDGQLRDDAEYEARWHALKPAYRAQLDATIRAHPAE